MPKIEFRGACSEVTGSKMIISDNDTKVLLDCGMFQGKKVDSYIKNRDFKDDIPDVDFCILSHAHIDHSGLLPSLTAGGYSGPIYSTPATKELCKHMLADSVSVFSKEIPIIRKMLKRAKIHTQADPIYDIDDVAHCMDKFIPIDYRTKTHLTDNISFSFHDSCHILGSASIKLNVSNYNKIWYTSDIGHNHSLLSNAPKVPEGINTLIIESTYGNKKREKEDSLQEVMDVVIDVYKRGGKLLIPTFSVARMQTLLLLIHKLQVLGMIPNIPVYVNSPLGVKVTHLYEKYEDSLNPDIIQFFKERGLQPFSSSNIKYISDAQESTILATKDETMIILSASGMMEGGFVREHAKHILPDPKSTILFVGYNGEGTLGRRIQDSNGMVTIDGENVRIRGKVETLHGFSAHADLDYIINYVEEVLRYNNVKNIFLVHGEKDAIENVKNILHKKGITNVVIPEVNTEYKL